EGVPAAVPALRTAVRADAGAGDRRNAFDNRRSPIDWQMAGPACAGGSSLGVVLAGRRHERQMRPRHACCPVAVRIGNSDPTRPITEMQSGNASIAITLASGKQQSDKPATANA